MTAGCVEEILHSRLAGNWEKGGGVVGFVTTSLCSSSLYLTYCINFVCTEYSVHSLSITYGLLREAQRESTSSTTYR